MLVTLDHNCIGALEKAEDATPYVKQLLVLHDAGRITLQLVAVGGSERKKDGTYSENIHEFLQRLTSDGIGHLPLLPTIGILDITFLDYSLAVDDQMVELACKIQNVLFPMIDFEHAEYLRKNPGLDINEAYYKWRNALCDVLTLWSHIQYDGDVFVSTDRNFHKATKKPKLIALGAKEILTPQDAVGRLTGGFPIAP